MIMWSYIFFNSAVPIGGHSSRSIMSLLFWVISNLPSPRLNYDSTNVVSISRAVFVLKNVFNQRYSFFCLLIIQKSCPCIHRPQALPPDRGNRLQQLEPLFSPYVVSEVRDRRQHQVVISFTGSLPPHYMCLALLPHLASQSHNEPATNREAIQGRVKPFHSHHSFLSLAHSLASPILKTVSFNALFQINRSISSIIHVTLHHLSFHHVLVASIT